MTKTVVITILSVVATANAATAQNLFFTRNGHVDFFSSTSVENIKANNEKVSSVVNINTGEMEFSVLNMAFEFKKALMQQHFNENYMESTKFPKSFFKGKITNVDQIKWTVDGEYPAEVHGDITIHGVTKNVSAKGTVVVKDGNFRATSAFVLKPEDFDIRIPGVVRNNIAKFIKISVDNTYEPLTKQVVLK
jgi:polyisoprenoid-binding protein YceI